MSKSDSDAEFWKIANFDRALADPRLRNAVFYMRTGEKGESGLDELHNPVTVARYLASEYSLDRAAVSEAFDICEKLLEAELQDGEA